MRPALIRTLLFGTGLLVPLTGFVVALNRKRQRPHFPLFEPSRREQEVHRLMIQARDAGDSRVAAQTARDYLLQEGYYAYRQSAKRIYRQYMDSIPLDVRLERFSVPATYFGQIAPEELDVQIVSSMDTGNIPILSGRLEKGRIHTPLRVPIARINYYPIEGELLGRVPTNTAREAFVMRMSAGGQLLRSWNIPVGRDTFNPALSRRGYVGAHRFPALKLGVIPPID